MINIPLNNAVQALDLGSIDASDLRAARERFEPQWNRWNGVRTWVASGVALVLQLILLRVSVG